MKISVNNIDELPESARRLVPVLRAHGGVVALHGGMGAGKTTLVAAIVHEMGSTDTVTSPTFALVNDYLVPADGGTGTADAGGAAGSREGGGAGVDGDDGVGGTAGSRKDDAGGTACWEHVYHFDFYRIDDVREAFDLGYEEYFYGGELCLVEWPEKIEPLLPEDALHLSIEVGPDGSRTITVE